MHQQYDDGTAYRPTDEDICAWVNPLTEHFKPGKHCVIALSFVFFALGYWYYIPKFSPTPDTIFAAFAVYLLVSATIPWIALKNLDDKRYLPRNYMR